MGYLLKRLIGAVTGENTLHPEVTFVAGVFENWSLALSHRREDVLEVMQTVVLKPAPDNGRGRSLRVWLGKAQVDQLIGREVRMQDNVEQPTLSLGQHLRHTGDGNRGAADRHARYGVVQGAR